MTTKPFININDLEYTTQHQHGDKFAARFAPVATLIGARKLGYRMTVVPPGKKAYPILCALGQRRNVFHSGRQRYAAAF